MSVLSRRIEFHAKPWRAFVVLAACCLCSCATSNSPKAGKIEFQRDGGFTITEQTRFSSSVRSDFKKALRLFDEEEYGSGIEALERVTDAAPHATTAHLDLGIAYRITGNFERAEASIKRALELNSRHPVALNELGIVYRKTGRFDEARESYQQALAISSDFHFARRNLAILCDVYLGDMACALEHYELYSKMVPEDEQASIWIADLRNRLRK
jgi:tetratricopeptide (TPR) repeat protein